MEEYPRLRAVQFIPAVFEGKRVGCLHDPQRISDKPLYVPWRLVPILAFLDGKHSLLDIQAEYTRLRGDLLFREELNNLIEGLDTYLYLESDRFHEFLENIRQEFLSSPVRPAFFSGQSYPADPGQLREEIKGYFIGQGGPGWPDKGRVPEIKSVTGLIAPHIDLRQGGHCYAWSYAELFHSKNPPDLFIIIGTCHTGIEGLFAFTKKTFLTPIGQVTCDPDFLGLLEQQSHTDIYCEEFLHRSEHTIEFQVIFLRFLWENFGADWPPLRICPILCSFSPVDFLERETVYREVIDILKNAIETSKRMVCIIASADLAHIGPKFGDPMPVNYIARSVCSSKDKHMLELIGQLDQNGFQGHIKEDNDRRRICGYPPITAMLDIIPPSEGMLLNYGSANVDDQGSMVSFASMVFYGSQ